MAPRKKSKGKKPAETMRQRQMRLRKLQQSLKTEKGGPIKKVESTKDALNRNRLGRIKRTKAAIGSEGSSQKRLPPGKSTTPKPSARRALAAAKLKRAATGTQGGTRVGQPKGAANRYYGADRVAKAVGRAQRSTAVRTGANILKGAVKGAGRLLAGRDDGSGSALLAAKMTSDAINAARGSTAKDRNSKKVNPAKRKMSNIPAKEGTGKKSPNDKKPQVKGAKQASQTSNRTPITRPAASKPQSKPPVKASKPSSAPSKPRSATPKTSSASAYKKHGSALHVGRYKTLKEHRAAVAAQKKKKQSPANKKGWQGNRNY